MASRLDDPARDRTTRLDDSGVVKAQCPNFFDDEPIRLPYAHADPARIRPPTHARPSTLLVNPPRPRPSARVIATHDVGRTQTQRAQIRDIVKIAQTHLAGKAIARDFAGAARKVGGPVEHVGCPFGKSAKRFCDRASRRIAQIQDGKQIRVVQPSAALSRNVERAAWLARRDAGKIGKDPIEIRAPCQAKAPCAMPSIARITGAAPSSASTSIGRAPPSSGSEPTSQRAALSRP